MNIVHLITQLNEVKKNNDVYSSGEGAKREKHKSGKSKVKTYGSIKQALGSGAPGQIFSTTAADRLYVISKGKWGKKSGRGNIAKGFTPGSSTPGSDFASIKKHAARTMMRYGSGGSQKLLKKYGSRSMKKKAGMKTD